MKYLVQSTLYGSKVRRFNESKESKENIESICEKHNITNYTINEDGSIDVNGEYFNCQHNKLTTLEGAPRTVGGYFNCSNNQLVNLKFAPSCQWLSCSNNPIFKWWIMVNNEASTQMHQTRFSKLDAFIDLGIDSRDPDFMNLEKIDLLNE